MTTTVPDTARIIYSHPDTRIEVRDVPVGPLEPHQVLVKTAWSYISAGTELTVLQMGSSLNLTMDVPTIPMGYSMAGIVMAVGADVSHVRPGDRVACVGEGAAHGTYAVMAKNLVVPVPDAVSLDDAAPAAMMCFALEGIRKARLQFGQNVLVAGAGLMGQFASQLAYASGTNVYLTDLHEGRLSHAMQGVRTFVGDDDGWNRLKTWTDPEGIEIALVCMGGPADTLYERIMGSLGRSPDGIHQGRVVLSGGAVMRIPFASQSGNVEFISSAKAGPGYRDAHYEAGNDYPMGYVPWTVTRNVAVLLAAIASGKLRVAPLITHRYPFDDAMAAYEKLATPRTDALAVLLDYSNAH